MDGIRKAFVPNNIARLWWEIEWAENDPLAGERQPKAIAAAHANVTRYHFHPWQMKLLNAAGERGTMRAANLSDHSQFSLFHYIIRDGRPNAFDYIIICFFVIIFCQTMFEMAARKTTTIVSNE